MNKCPKLTSASRKEIPQVKKCIRSKIPYLTIQQIRRLKLPLADALQIELEELNQQKALKLFQEILKIDQKHKNVFCNRKNLSILEEIFDSIKDIEGKTEEQVIITIIEITKKFFNENENFDWLIEFLLIKAHQLVSDYELEQSKTSTILSYLHGLSLSHRLHWYRAALLYFESAFNNALKNDDWIFEDEKFSTKIIPELSDCLIKLSKEIRIGHHNPKDASIYSYRALTILRKITVNENLRFEIDAEIEVGDCLMEQRSFDEANAHFEHGLGLSEFGGIKEKYCECLIKIAKCFKGMNEMEKHKKLLELTKEYANVNSLNQHKGEILILEMEYYIEELDIEKVSEVFFQAFDCFILDNNQQKLLEIEVLFAHAGAKLNFNELVDMILRADKSQVGNNSYLQKLIKWIDQKSSTFLQSEESEKLNPNEFIETYYDPDEIVTKKNVI